MERSASFHLEPLQNHVLQPGEWKGIHFGIQFTAERNLFCTPELLVPLELRNGLAMQGCSALLTSGEEFALPVVNSTNTVQHLRPGTPMVKLIVDYNPPQEMLLSEIHWSCPKCSLGGPE